MRALKNFLKTTIVGGLLFLVPLILLLVKRLGVGSALALRQADLTPVPEG